MGKKGNTTVQSYTPTEEEKRLMEQASAYAEAVAPNALALNNEAAKLLFGSYGTVQADYDQMNTAAQQQIATAQQGLANLTGGQLPAAYQQNMENAISQGLQNTLGTTLQSLADRGVLNSSVTNTALQGISDSAANTLAAAYQSNLNNLASLYNQQISAASQPIALSAAAQEAAQNPALQLWQSSLGLNGATTGALSALGNQGTHTGTTYTSSSGLLGGVLTGAAGSLFCFTGDTLVATPTGDRPIKRIKQGDLVLAVQEDGSTAPAKVLACLTPRYSEIYTVIAGENAVSTTLSQPLRLKDGTDRLVQDLTIGDELARVGRVTGIVHSGQRKVYDLKTEGTNYYLAGGFIAKGGDREWDS